MMGSSRCGVPLWLFRLPFSGNAMKGVTVLALKAGATDNDEDFESVPKDAFEGDEIFGEAVSDMLKKPARLPI